LPFTDERWLVPLSPDIGLPLVQKNHQCLAADEGAIEQIADM